MSLRAQPTQPFSVTVAEKLTKVTSYEALLVLTEIVADTYVPTDHAALKKALTEAWCRVGGCKGGLPENPTYVAAVENLDHIAAAAHNGAHQEV
jgi:hypothetical protein